MVHNPGGFKRGYTPIVGIDSAIGIGFGILKLKSGESKDLTSERETACLLMSGRLTFRYGGKVYAASRRSIFDEDPIAIHFARSVDMTVSANSACELAIFRVKNDKRFPAVVFDSRNMVSSERRGKGILEDTSYRIVRTIFDLTNRPESNMVLGEDINFQGRWSSYPPHHHPQPEIYHYRFTDPRGYGHAEMGDDVFKIRNYDTLKITGRRDHAQVAAPGYGMYYIWAIRHLGGHPYRVPDFTEDHRWTIDPKANFWRPKR
jgi:5-deoxy-D-glucuronate isomerase